MQWEISQNGVPFEITITDSIFFESNARKITDPTILGKIQGTSDGKVRKAQGFPCARSFNQPKLFGPNRGSQTQGGDGVLIYKTCPQHSNSEQCPIRRK